MRRPDERTDGEGSKTADTGGSATHDDLGQGEPPLLLVHGLGSDRTMWRGLAQRLAARQRVVAVDLPRGDRPASIAAHADALAVLVARLGIDRAVVIGHSRGGLVALDFAARYSQRTRALAILESMVLPPDPVLAGLGPMIEGLGGEDHRAFGARLMTHLIGPHMPAADRDRLVARFTSTARAELVAGMREMSTFDSAAAAARVTCPLLFVGTGPPYSDLPRLRVLCPQLVTAQLVGCGHYFPVECPDQLAATITRFLETQLT